MIGRFLSNPGDILLIKRSTAIKKLEKTTRYIRPAAIADIDDAINRKSNVLFTRNIFFKKETRCIALLECKVIKRRRSVVIREARKAMPKKADIPFQIRRFIFTVSCPFMVLFYAILANPYLSHIISSSANKLRGCWNLTAPQAWRIFSGL